PELVRQNQRLDRVEPRGVADALVQVALALPVLAQAARAGGDGRVVRDERSCVAHRAEVLARVEAERRCAADGAGAKTSAPRTVRLAGVFDDRQISLRRQLSEARQ